MDELFMTNLQETPQEKMDSLMGDYTKSVDRIHRRVVLAHVTRTVVKGAVLAGVAFLAYKYIENQNTEVD